MGNIYQYLFIVFVLVLVVIVILKRNSIERISVSFENFKDLKAAIDFDSKLFKEIEEKSSKARKVIENKHKPQRFGASIIQIGGIGSRLINKEVYSLEEHAFFEPDNFISVGFNTPNDLMWVFCADNYKIVKTQGSNRIIDGDPPEK